MEGEFVKTFLNVFKNWFMFWKQVMIHEAWTFVMLFKWPVNHLSPWRHLVEDFKGISRSSCLQEIWWSNLILFMPVLALITRVISSVHVIFCGSWKQGFATMTLEVNLTGRKYRAYGTVWYKYIIICCQVTLSIQRIYPDCDVLTHLLAYQWENFVIPKNTINYLVRALEF